VNNKFINPRSKLVVLVNNHLVDESSSEQEHSASAGTSSADSNQESTWQPEHHHDYTPMPPVRGFWESRLVKSSQIYRAALYVLSVITVIIFLWIVILYVPRYINYGASITAINRATAEASFRNSLVTAIVGLSVLGGLYYTARNLRLSQSGQLTDRFSKAVEQLGNPDINVRMGGLYALERVARDSGRDAATVTEVLIRFIRNRTIPEQPDESLKVADDVNVALKAIGRRPGVDQEFDRLDLSHLTINGASLEFANLKDANLCYVSAVRVNFGAASLKAAEFGFADARRSFFTNADIRKCSFYNTDLRYSFFSNAKLDYVDFRNADLRHTIFGGSGERNLPLRFANMKGARLDGAKFKNVDLRTVVGITQEQIDTAILDPQTILPPELLSRVAQTQTQDDPN
jgi:pentapeptide repeat protein